MALVDRFSMHFDDEVISIPTRGNRVPLDHENLKLHPDRTADGPSPHVWAGISATRPSKPSISEPSANQVAEQEKAQNRDSDAKSLNWIPRFRCR